MGRDIQDLSFLGPRIMDKLVLALIIMSLYWRVGANTAPSNVNNITAVLFLWTILPGYAAASYMPSIVLERPLFVRCAPASAKTLTLGTSPPCCACGPSCPAIRPPATCRPLCWRAR